MPNAENVGNSRNFATSGKVCLLVFFYQSVTVECTGLRKEFFYFNTMASHKLPNYLRAYRKRLSLSQDEIAYLLGNESGAKVCRYECFLREPAFRAALAYELIFQKSGKELFAGIYDRVGREVAARALTLLRQLDGSKSTRRNARKKEALEAIISLFGKK